MDKKRKIQLVIIIILIVSLSCFLTYVLGKAIYDFTRRTKDSHQIVEQFSEIYEKNTTQIILFASPTCKWCKSFVPILNEISKEYNIKYNYLDVSVLTEQDFNKIFDTLNIKIDGIPNLIVIDQKKVIGRQSGAQSKEKTIEFLESINLIGGEKNVESISNGG